VALFLQKGLLNREFARTLLSWRHSGFSIDSGTRIYDSETRQGLCQYIIRAPLAMQKLEWDEEQDTVPRAGNCTATWKSSPTGYFQGKQVHFSCLDFIAQLTLHIPRPAAHARQARFALARQQGAKRPARGAPRGRLLTARVTAQERTARGQIKGNLEEPPGPEQPRPARMVWA
jgi:hypothetical protein